MKIRYLSEKKNHCRDSPYGWFSWSFEYIVDYKKRKSIKVIYKGYIQKDRVKQWSEKYEEKITIFRDEYDPKRICQKTTEKIIGEGFF